MTRPPPHFLSIHQTLPYMTIQTPRTCASRRPCLGGALMIEFGHCGIRSASYLADLVRVDVQAPPVRSSVQNSPGFLDSRPRPGPLYNSTQLDAFTLSRLEHPWVSENSRLPATSLLVLLPIHFTHVVHASTNPQLPTLPTSPLLYPPSLPHKLPHTFERITWYEMWSGSE